MSGGAGRQQGGEKLITEVLEGKASICECCDLDNHEMFFIIGKYLENKNRADKFDINQGAKVGAALIKEDLRIEDYYYNFITCTLCSA